MHCPICDFSDEDEYALTLHINGVHFADQPTANLPLDETSTPERISAQHQRLRELQDVSEKQGGSASVSGEDEYTICPEDDCNEQVRWCDIQEHMDFHIAERVGLESEEDLDSSDDLHISKYESLNHSMPYSERSSLARHAPGPNTLLQDGFVAVKRLGRKELGPYAYEAQMPSLVFNILQHGSKTKKTSHISPRTGRIYQVTQVENEIRGIIEVLADLTTNDTQVEKTWLCHPGVQYIHRIKGEGAFCGYRNLQMLLSFIINTRWPGSAQVVNLMDRQSAEREDVKIPSIFDLQVGIEAAWGQGYCASGRVETGGIKGTRKYIGPPEVQALLLSLDIQHEVIRISDVSFKDKRDGRNTTAHEQLLDRVQSYYISSAPDDPEKTDASTEAGSCVMTSLPPIYLQQPGHSMTIVGIEKLKDGTRNLLVLDPSFKPSPPIMKLLGSQMHKPKSTTRTTPSTPTKEKSTKLTKTNPASRNSTTPTKGNARIDGWVRRKDGSVTTASMNKVIDGSNTVDRETSLQVRTPGAEGTWSPQTSPASRKRKIQSRESNRPAVSLNAYRRGERRLRRHREFELVFLTGSNCDNAR